MPCSEIERSVSKLEWVSLHHCLLLVLDADRITSTDDYLTKPLRKPDLLAIINKIVLQRRAGESSSPFSPECIGS